MGEHDMSEAAMLRAEVDELRTRLAQSERERDIAVRTLEAFGGALRSEAERMRARIAGLPSEVDS